MNSIKLQKFSLPALVCGIAAYQVHNDYKKADISDKKNVILRDILVLGGTCAGAYTGNALLNKKIPENCSKTTKCLKFLINNMSIPIGGIIGGLLTSEGAEKFFPSKHISIKKAVKEAIDNNLNKNQKNDNLYSYSKNFTDKIDPGTIGKAYDYLDIGVGSVFDNTFSTLSGFNVGREDGLKNKLLKASNEIIAGELIPVTTVVALTSYLKNKKMNNFSKGIIIAPVALVSCYVGNAVGNWFNKKVAENLVKKEFWVQISEQQKNWRHKLYTNIFDFYQFKIQNQSLEELKKNIPNLSKSEKIKQKISKHQDSKA